MRPAKYTAQLFFKCEPQKRIAVERLAEDNGLSLGEAARLVMNAGFVAKGIEC